jgi:hypothetical protein
MPGKLFFLSSRNSSVLYVGTLYPGALQYIRLIEDLVQLRAQKHKPTMASAASPRATNPKMVESPASMAHESSSYACAEDEYFKCPHTASTDGNIWLDSGWFFVSFGVGGRLTHN